jgi:AraC-like DNA-binding protein
MSSGYEDPASVEDPARSVSAPAYFDVVLAARDLDLVAPQWLKVETCCDRLQAQGLARIGRPDLLALWRCLDRHASVRHFGLLIGQRIAPDTKGLLASWVSQCATLGEALNVFARHILLMSHFETLVCRQHGEVVEIEHIVRGLDGCPIAFSERSLSALIAWASHLTQRRILPRKACFVWSKPAYWREYLAVFGNRLTFESERNVIILDASLLDLPICSANTYLKQMLREQAIQTLRTLDSPTNLVERVCAGIQRHLTNQTLSVASISQELGVTRQTLYRRLKTDGVTFSQLHDRIRQEQARQLLSLRAISTDELSERLGFRDVSACSKAFRRWFGMTPSAFRRQLELTVTCNV